MSPRKKHENRSQNNEDQKVRKLPFTSRKFYLDLRSRASTTTRQLIEEIPFLGGTIEEFFSREVNVVITDAPDWKIRKEVDCTATPLSASPLANAVSPQSGIGDENRSKTKSRAEAIVERSRQQNLPKGTAVGNFSASDAVLNNAKKWKIDIWGLNKTVRWLDDFKKSQKKQKSRQSSQQTKPDPYQTRYFSNCYIKFETFDRSFKPVYQDLKRFPEINLKGYSGTSPFYSTENKAPLKVSPAQSQPKRPVPFPFLTNPIKYKIQRIEQQDKPIESPGKSGGKDKKKPRQHFLDDVSGPRGGSKKDSKPGYCELCDVNFDLLARHLKDERHRGRVENEETWKKLDECILLVNQVYGSGHEALECGV